MLSLANRTNLDFSRGTAPFPDDGLHEGQTVGNIFIDYVDETLLPLLDPGPDCPVMDPGPDFTAILDSDTAVQELGYALRIVHRKTWFQCLQDGRFLANGIANVTKLRDTRGNDFLVCAFFKDESTGHGWQFWNMNSLSVPLPAGSLVLSRGR